MNVIKISTIAALMLFATVSFAATPQTVYFPSADGTTELVGYLFRPEDSSPSPAVVMLHGRAGPYSANVNARCTKVGRGEESPCNAQSLSRRHQMWGEYWSQQGYIALLVDSFGPRSRGHGYGRFTHDNPDRQAVNELTVRPLDAEGALEWLTAQTFVRADQVMLQGWSNGGSTVLNTVHRQATRASNGPRFRAALAFYPGCGPKAVLARSLRADIPITLLLGSNDEQVSPTVCRDLAERSSPPLDVQWYEGATHGFDDPGTQAQSLPSNRSAQRDTLERAVQFFRALSQ